MKRTATTLVLLAGIGGGCAGPATQTQGPPQTPAAPQGGFGTVTRGKEIGGVQGPAGEPVMASWPAAKASGKVSRWSEIW
ncbi:MAG: hypothetical protein K2V38_25530, partial [Gemmataceae bacterium]|nr:hypothetical protein [Gemmataceae bacterium]